jgi:riboflavin biosynthesis pyrimidine reductase
LISFITHPSRGIRRKGRRDPRRGSDAGTYAIAFDRSGRLHFAKPDIGGDHVVVLLGPGVPDAHLAELGATASPTSSRPTKRWPRPLLELLARGLGIKRLLVEGGGNVNRSLLAAGVVDEISLLVAPAIDGAVGVTGVFEVPEAAGLAGKVRLRFVGSEALGHGVVRLRYGVEPI